MMPPSCNTGATYDAPPHPSTLSTERKKTIIDWFSVSYTEPLKAIDRLHMQTTILGLIGPGTPIELGETEKGHHGYPCQRKVLHGNYVLGWFSYGAEHRRAWLVITGDGLRYRREKQIKDEQLEEFEQLPDCTINRCDIALDIFDGSFTVSDSFKAHGEGLYRLPQASKTPASKFFGSKDEHDDTALTHYIGSRKGAKFARVYDKGLQIMGGKSPEDFWAGVARGLISTPELPEGQLEQWVRVELESKKTKDRPVPWDMPSQRDQYFAGAYPIFATLLGQHDGVRPEYLPRPEEVEVDHLVQACRASYGGLIYHLREQGFEDTQIVEMIIGEKKAARIKADKHALNDCPF